MRVQKHQKNRLLKMSVLLCSLSAVSSCQDPAQMQAMINLGTQVLGQAGNGQLQLANGIKDMLQLSSERASGYLSSQAVWSLLLPPDAQKLVSTLRVAGFGSYVDKVQATMDKAAAKAALEAQPIFKQAINDMTIVDAIGIWRGGNSAATQYFRTKTESALRAKFAPIVQNALQQTGYYGQYQSLLNVYNTIPFTNKPNLDVENYMLTQTMDSLFNKMASEEAAIRQNPAQKGNQLITSILKTVQ